MAFSEAEDGLRKSRTFQLKDEGLKKIKEPFTIEHNRTWSNGEYN